MNCPLALFSGNKGCDLSLHSTCFNLRPLSTSFIMAAQSGLFLGRALKRNFNITFSSTFPFSSEIIPYYPCMVYTLDIHICKLKHTVMNPIFPVVIDPINNDNRTKNKFFLMFSHFCQSDLGRSTYHYIQTKKN